MMTKTIEEISASEPEARLQVPIPQQAIRDFCHRHHIGKLSLFGSILRDDFGPQSDVDVLVEFEPGKTPGFAIVTMQQELSKLLGGRAVDLRTPQELSRYIRDRVLKEAFVLYVDN
ncbi:MAG: nucleotidyltransferase family protein [Thermostichus sp. HHBFW_bins_43]